MWIIAASKNSMRPALTFLCCPLNHWTNLTVSVIDTACIFLYWIAIFDKLALRLNCWMHAADLRVLGIGSVIGFGRCPGLRDSPRCFDIDTSSRWMGTTAGILSLAFPFTLAYVVVVQRAMDVRILLRMGTKYALARATLATIRVSLLATLIASLIVALRSPSLTPAPPSRLRYLPVSCSLLRSQYTKNLILVAGSKILSRSLQRGAVAC